MTTVDVPLTKSDFDQCDWQSVLTSSTRKTCLSYSPLFDEKAEEAKISGKSRVHKVFTFLADITYPGLKLHDKKNPFTGGEIFHTLSDEQLNILADLAPQVVDAEMRARMADILWIRKHPTRLRVGRIAIDAYLESAARLEDPTNWIECVQRIERAVRLAASLDKRAKGPYFSKAIAHVEEALARYNGDDPLFLSTTLMEVLQEQGVGDLEKYAALAEKSAGQAEAHRSWHKVIRCLIVQAKWHTMGNKADEAYAARMAVAETYVKQAQECLNGPNPSYSLASRHLRSAIKVLRDWGGKKERIEDLEKQLLVYQAKSVSEMKRVAASIDFSDISERARAQVKGKSLHEALIALACLGTSPHVSDLQRQVEEAIQNFPLQHILAVELINEIGKTTGTRDSLYPGNSVTAASALRAEMFSRAKMHQEGHALFTVEPARVQMNLEHRIHVEDLLSFVSQNPFVPQGREYIYARGLHAGLGGDFLVAAHLLLPQVENSIRHLLYQQGQVVSNLTSHGIQNELDLNTVFEKFQKELIAVLGRDITFDLEGLLVERFGSNLRNETAHGLMNHDRFYSGPSIYFWWLTLHLCILYKLMTSETGQVTNQEPQEDAISHEKVDSQ